MIYIIPVLFVSIFANMYCLMWYRRARFSMYMNEKYARKYLILSRCLAGLEYAPIRCDCGARDGKHSPTCVRYLVSAAIRKSESDGYHNGH